MLIHLRLCVNQYFYLFDLFRTLCQPVLPSPGFLLLGSIVYIIHLTAFSGLSDTTQGGGWKKQNQNTSLHFFLNHDMWSPTLWEAYKLQVWVTLWPTTSQSVSQASFGTHDKILICSHTIMVLFFMGYPVWQDRSVCC